jgi:hypothetical protein
MKNMKIITIFLGFVVQTHKSTNTVENTQQWQVLLDN